VTLTNAFYIGKTEVTQAQWTAKMGSNPSYCVPPNVTSSDTTKPVEQVSWNMIASGSTSFMSLTGLRLPTEAEWEYACRAGTTTARYGVLNDIAWNLGNAGSTTHAVATKLPNALGLYDTLGNVFEWSQDWYEPFSSGSVTNPTGPATGSQHLLHGGSWAHNSDYCRASLRAYAFTPDFANYLTGFRAARNP
jgi:formylglycine-generating enzyme required for sulfatase activity